MVRADDPYCGQSFKAIFQETTPYLESAVRVNKACCGNIINWATDDMWCRWIDWNINIDQFHVVNVNAGQEH